MVRAVTIATVLCALAASVDAAPQHRKRRSCPAKHHPSVSSATIPTPSVTLAPSADINNLHHVNATTSSAKPIPTVSNVSTTVAPVEPTTDVVAPTDSSNSTETVSPVPTGSANSTETATPLPTNGSSIASPSDAPTSTGTELPSSTDSGATSIETSANSTATAAPTENPTTNSSTEAAPSSTEAPSSTVSSTAVPTESVVATGEPQYLDSENAMAQALLKRINSKRSEHNVAALEWNNDAAGKAWDQAQRCEWNVTYEVTQSTYPDIQSLLVTGTEDYSAGIDALMNVNYNAATPGLEGENSQARGYANILWRATTGVGCAWNKCPNMDERGTMLLTCMFDAHGTYHDSDPKAFAENVPA